MIYYGKKEKRLSLENGVVFDMKKERIKYITIFAITFILEVIIAKYVHDKIIRPYIGDVLVVICLYTFAKSIFLDKIKLLSLYVLILAVIVEILQYFNYAQILFGDNKIAKTLLGSSFDIKDILCYVVGYLIIILIEIITIQNNKIIIITKIEIMVEIIITTIIILIMEIIILEEIIMVEIIMKTMEIDLITEDH